MAPRPILFQYLDDGNTWPERQKTENPGEWEFIEYDGNLLDNGLFVQNPSAVDDLMEYLDRVVPD